jgi:hypothetical protein
MFYKVYIKQHINAVLFSEEGIVQVKKEPESVEEEAAPSVAFLSHCSLSLSLS